VRLEAAFAPGWDDVQTLGLVLNAVDKSSYEFLLTAPEDRTHAKERAPGTMQSRQAWGGMLEARLTRNGVVLQKFALRAPRGPLTMVAGREGDRLTLRINDDQVLDFDDPFALSTASPGVFGVILPPQVGIQRLVARRQGLPANPSPLEQGDELYSAARYEGELAFYQAASRTGSPDSAFEPQYKAALCLERLGREAEAAKILAALAELRPVSDSDPSHEWSLRAACQLWSLRVRHQQWQLADEILPRLTAEYGQEELARLVPADEHELVLEEYRRAGRTPPSR
jgi:hypothetical protein